MFNRFLRHSNYVFDHAIKIFIFIEKSTLRFGQRNLNEIAVSNIFQSRNNARTNLGAQCKKGWKITFFQPIRSNSSNHHNTRRGRRSSPICAVMVERWDQATWWPLVYNGSWHQICCAHFPKQVPASAWFNNVGPHLHTVYVWLFWSPMRITHGKKSSFFGLTFCGKLIESLV